MKLPIKGMMGMFSKTSKAKEMPSLTQFLVTNPLFRRLVIGFHNEKVEAIEKVDNYLEKELLSKDEYNSKYNCNRVDEGQVKSSSDKRSGNR